MTVRVTSLGGTARQRIRNLLGEKPFLFPVARDGVRPLNTECEPIASKPKRSHKSLPFNLNPRRRSHCRMRRTSHQNDDSVRLNLVFAVRTSGHVSWTDDLMIASTYSYCATDTATSVTVSTARNPVSGPYIQYSTCDCNSIRAIGYRFPS